MKRSFILTSSFDIDRYILAIITIDSVFHLQIVNLFSSAEKKNDDDVQHAIVVAGYTAGCAQ